MMRLYHVPTRRIFQCTESQYNARVWGDDVSTTSVDCVCVSAWPRELMTMNSGRYTRRVTCLLRDGSVRDVQVFPVSSQEK